MDGNFSCSGFLELHKQGLWGAVARIPHTWTRLVTAVCQELRCGTAGSSQGEPEPGIHLPVRWEAVDSCGNHSLPDCFNRTRSRGKTPAFITCSGESAPETSVIPCSAGIAQGDFGAGAENQRHPCPPHPPAPALPLRAVKVKLGISDPGSAEEGAASQIPAGIGEHWQGPGCGHFPEQLPCLGHLPAPIISPARAYPWISSLPEHLSLAVSISQPQASPCPFP